MEYKNFITTEEVSLEQNNIKTLIRFVSSLTLLRQILVPTLLIILCAAATPAYFLWFVGELVDCYGSANCSIKHEFIDWQLVIPASLSSLVVIALLAILCRVGAWSLFELSGQWSTQNIQAAMMHSISKVRTTFFDENPSGR